LIISFGEEWLIDGGRFTSFAAGLHDRQSRTPSRRLKRTTRGRERRGSR
jgi:hypothetical protein